MKKRKYITTTDMGCRIEFPETKHGWIIYIFQPGLNPKKIRIEETT